MARTITLIVVLAVGALFWALVPLYRLFDAYQPMVVALSVIIGAVFVRLNRGMPTLEWKSLDRDKRKKLTAKIVDLSKEYVAIVVVNGLVLIVLIILIVIGKDKAAELSDITQSLISGMIGALFALCVARMSYVVWRDCDIIELQRYLIDSISEREQREAEIKAADEKIAGMKSAGLVKQSVADVAEL